MTPRGLEAAIGTLAASVEQTLETEAPLRIGDDTYGATERDQYLQYAKKLLGDASLELSYGNLDLAAWLYRYAQGFDIISRCGAERSRRLQAAIDEIFDGPAGPEST
jgi:hypothetical protein